MNCMKCGKQIPERRVFCELCLEDMESYPVSPGTPVQLPTRKAAPEQLSPQSRKKQPTPEEQMEHLHAVIRWLVMAVAILSLLLVLSAVALFHAAAGHTPQETIGKNYSSMTTTQTQPPA